MADSITAGGLVSARHGRLSRRRFLALAAAPLVHLAPPREPRPGGTGSAVLEGLYADRFTYRQGEPILVHASLADTGSVDFELLRHDTSVSILQETHPAHVPNHFNQWDAAARGARFLPVLEIDTSALPPGIYEVRMPRSALRPENQLLQYNAFPSDPTLARFVVTAPELGSHSRNLWVHDSLTGVCYGSFGGGSIYGEPGVITDTVSYQRPGLDRETVRWEVLRFLLQNGYDFEYTDLVGLSLAPADYLEAYDWVVVLGQHEYVTYDVRDKLQRHVQDGRNLLIASNEFSAFSARLDPLHRTLTTFKYRFEEQDPLHAAGDPAVAGVTMNTPQAIRETEVAGQTLWAALKVSQATPVDMQLHDSPDTRWILAGTGLHNNDSFSGAFDSFALGNRLEFGPGGKPLIVDPAFSGTPDGTFVWAWAPSADGRAWWMADGNNEAAWPLLSDGYATATLRESPAGGTVVTLPSDQFFRLHLDDPLYTTVLLNIASRLTAV